MPRRSRAERDALIQAALAGGVATPHPSYSYPRGWFDAPLFVVTPSHVKIHHRIVEEPIFEDPIALARFVRQLVAESKAMGQGARRYIPAAVWEPIVAAYGARCAYCGADGVPLEKDHRVPVSKGGSDDPDNLVPACRPCNNRKSNHPPEDWPIVVQAVWDA